MRPGTFGRYPQINPLLRSGTNVITAEHAVPRRPPPTPSAFHPLRHVIKRDSREEHEEIRSEAMTTATER